MQEMRGKKALGRWKRNSTIAEINLFFVSNYFKCKCIKLSNQNTEIGGIGKNI